MIPGEYFLKDGEIIANADKPVIELLVANTGDRPIQVGSHFHFYEVNSALRFDRVLMVNGDSGAQFGSPVIQGALVKASVVGEVRGPKIRVFKKKKRSTYRRTNGHRQDLLRIRIEGIELP